MAYALSPSLARFQDGAGFISSMVQCFAIAWQDPQNTVAYGVLGSVWVCGGLVCALVAQGPLKCSALAFCSSSSLAPREVPRSTSGWIQKGKELDPAYVNFCRTFKAPQAKFLMMWAGDHDVDQCGVLSCVRYEKMTGATAKELCAAGVALGLISEVSHASFVTSVACL